MAGEGFGQVVLRRGTRLIVGHPDDGVGRVELLPTSEIFMQVSPALGVDGDRFGAALADAGGASVFVGAPGGAGGGMIYLMNVFTGTLQEVVLDVTLDPGDEFGATLSGFDDWLIVGAPGDDDAGVDAGAVYAFHWVPGGFLPPEKIVPSALVSGARFGSHIVGGSTLLAAAGSQAFAHRVEFQPTTGELLESASFEPPPGSDSLGFGQGLAFDSDRVYIGAPDANGGVGRVLVFDKDGTLDAAAELELPPGLGATGRFGTDLHVVEGAPSALTRRLLVGAPGDDRVHLYESTSGPWTHAVELTSPNGSPGDRFGTQVHQEFVSAPNRSGTLGQSGAGAIDLIAVDAGDCAHIVRGDHNSDGALDVGDPISMLETLFVIDFFVPSCLDASDANDDGAFNISDPIYVLDVLFLDGPVIDTRCGPDTEVDALGCAVYDACP